jgi:ComF family protein
MLKDLLRLFFPHICPLCNSSMLPSETVICFACKHELPKTNFHLFPTDNILAQTFWGRTKLQNVVAYYYYTKGLKTQKLVHMLKYKGRDDAGREVGRLYGLELKESAVFEDLDFLVPVPLHKRKKRIRGFNQAEVIADGLSESMGVPIDTSSLLRIGFTETQTKKSRFARWKNVSEMFHLSDVEKLSNKHVAIVDDVITTGATLESCINELKKAPGIRVSVIAMAVASS